MAERRRVALVTGGAKRVGRALVERFVREGFDVFLTFHHSEGEAEQILSAPRSPGQVVRAIRADLTEPDAAVPAVWAEFGRHFDRLDVLVNNASRYSPGTLAETKVDEMRKLFAIHIESPMLLCQRFRP